MGTLAGYVHTYASRVRTYVCLFYFAALQSEVNETYGCVWGRTSSGSKVRGEACLIFNVCQNIPSFCRHQLLTWGHALAIFVDALIWGFNVITTNQPQLAMLSEGDFFPRLLLYQHFYLKLRGYLPGLPGWMLEIIASSWETKETLLPQTFEATEYKRNGRIEGLNAQS